MVDPAINAAVATSFALLFRNPTSPRIVTAKLRLLAGEK